MTTADWAFVVSLFSAAVSLGGLMWNIWSKFIHPKPRVRAYVAVYNIYGDGRTSDPFIGMYATNFGPTETTLKGVICRARKPGFKHWFRDRWQMGILNTYAYAEEAIAGRSPPSGGLPKKLAVGDEVGVFMVFDHEGLRDRKIIDVGFYDVFGRHHWCKRAAVRDLRRRLRLPKGGED